PVILRTTVTQSPPQIEGGGLAPARHHFYHAPVTRHRSAFLAAGVLLVVFGRRATTADTRPTTSAEHIRADVARLATDAFQGRRAGTPEADAAADWIAGEFRRICLLPAGDAGTYLQSFSFI